MGSFSIFDLKKVPATDSPLFSSYGEDSVDILANHYAKDLLAESVHGIEFEKEAVVCTDVCTEWKTYCQLLSKQPREDLKSQLKELATNETTSVGKTSVERSFSQMKLIKTRLCNRIGELSLSNLIKVAIEYYT